MKRTVELEFDVKEQAAVDAAMKERCEERGHDWENACSILFQVYQVCKWCGAKR